MSERFDIAVLDGGVAAESPRRGVDGGSDPFSASSEARVHELVIGHRRHGLHTAIRPDAHSARNRADERSAGSLAGYLRSTYVDPRRPAS
jgi:hypothetical protein